ncbi:hypothetical protein NKH79_17285 [Mesorhizobium sp. M0977]
MRFRLACAVATSMLLAGCVADDVGPINVFTPEAGRPSPAFIPDPGDDGSTVLGLASPVAAPGPRPSPTAFCGRWTTSSSTSSRGGARWSMTSG